MILLGDFNPVIDLALKNGPFAALLLIILWGGFKREPWWVFGWYAREMRERLKQKNEECDSWKELALRSTNLAETVNDLSRHKMLP